MCFKMSQDALEEGGRSVCFFLKKIYNYDTFFKKKTKVP